jgi:hypothetical protein
MKRPKLVDGGTVWYGRPVRGRRVPIAATVFSLVVSIASQLGAAEPTTDGVVGTVVFAVDSRSRDAQAMIDAVRAHLTGLPVRLVIEPANEGSASNGADAAKDGSRRIGTLTIDAVTPGEWVVSFTEPAIDTTLVRRIRIKPQGKAVALEEAAIVVRSMVEAILDGGHVGIARPPPREEPLASRAPWQSRRAFAASAGYLGTTFGPGLGWQSGAFIGLRWQSSGFYAGIISEIFTPITTEQGPISLLLVRRPGAIVAGYEGASRVAPTIEIDFTIDYVTRTTVGARDGYQLTPPQSRWFFGLGMMGGVSWTFLPRFRLLAQVGADWILNPYSYVLSPTVAAPVVETSTIRPKGSAGIAIDVW